MNRWILILFMGALGLASCEPAEQSKKVQACFQSCERNQRLINLNTKVMYKPIKLCKKKCKQTEGTCTTKGAQVISLNQCIFFGVNAGRPPGKSGRLFQ